MSWSIAHGEYINSEIEDGNLINFDTGNTHYWLHDVEQFISEHDS